MENFKNKIYNYEAAPPEGLWNNIAKELDKEKMIGLPGLRKRSKLLFYGLTAAASLLIIFLITLFFNKTNKSEPIANSSDININNPQKIKDSISQNYQILETIINAPQEKKLVASNFEKQKGEFKKYITIAGPEGQPVKISPKAATLIISADKEFPPKTVWDKKIDRWKQIMLNNTTSPTATCLADILQLTANTENAE